MSQEPVSELERHQIGNLPSVTWGWRQIGSSLLILLAAYLLVSLALVLPAQETFGEDSDGYRFAAAAATALIDLILAGGLIYLTFNSGGSLGSLGFRRPVEGNRRPISSFVGGRGFPWGYTTRLVTGAFVAATVTTFGYTQLVQATGLDELLPREQIEAEYFEAASVTAMLGVSVVAIAPVVEEMFFRGFLFGGLAKMWGLWPGAIASSLVFSLVHFQLGLIIPFGIIGFILAYAYYRSGSLWSPVAVHFLFNSFSFMVLVLVPEARS